MFIVTGGAGLIGSAVVHGLNQRGSDNILVVDHLGLSEKWRNLAPLKYRDYLEKDAFEQLLDQGRLPARLSGPLQAIIHLGACSSTTERDASYLIRNNFEYSRKIALFAQEKGVRLIYASSAATYGNGKQGFCDDETLLPGLRPMNMYGYSKQLFDLWAQQHGLLTEIVGLKYYNVFGPNEQHKGEMRSLVQKAFEQITATGRLKLFKSHRSDYADGEQVRDFVYVKDAAAMTLHFLDNRGAAGIFNVGGGSTASWNRLATAVFNAMELPVAIDYIDMPESIRETYQYRTCAETQKIKQSGYTASAISLEDAISDYIRNYLMPNRHLGDA